MNRGITDELLVVERVRVEQPHRDGRKPRAQVVLERVVLARHELVEAAPERVEDLAGRAAVGAAHVHARVDLALEPRDPDHEELVQVRAEDREELEPLEERHVGVERLLEHALVEVEPGELPAPVALRGLGRVDAGTERREDARLREGPRRARGRGRGRPRARGSQARGRCGARSAARQADLPGLPVLTCT